MRLQLLLYLCDMKSEEIFLPRPSESDPSIFADCFADCFADFKLPVSIGLWRDLDVRLKFDRVFHHPLLLTSYDMAKTSF